MAALDHAELRNLWANEGRSERATRCAVVTPLHKRAFGCQLRSGRRDPPVRCRLVVDKPLPDADLRDLGLAVDPELPAAGRERGQSSSCPPTHVPQLVMARRVVRRQEEVLTPFYSRQAPRCSTACCRPHLLAENEPVEIGNEVPDVRPDVLHPPLAFPDSGQEWVRRVVDCEPRLVGVVEISVLLRVQAETCESRSRACCSRR